MFVHSRCFPDQAIFNRHLSDVCVLSGSDEPSVSKTVKRVSFQCCVRFNTNAAGTVVRSSFVCHLCKRTQSRSDIGSAVWTWPLFLTNHNVTIGLFHVKFKFCPALLILFTVTVDLRCEMFVLGWMWIVYPPSVLSDWTLRYLQDYDNCAYLMNALELRVCIVRGYEIETIRSHQIWH